MQLKKKDYFYLLFIIFTLPIYYYFYSYHDWLPHDEGVLGLSAQYVNKGLIPHVDFSGTYTGGLAYLHALSFRIFGDNSLSMRYTLLFFATISSPVVFLILRLFVAAELALLATFFAGFWGAPFYFASLPSWYYLYLGLFSLLFTLLFNQSNKIIYLMVAGGLCGFSILLKITGIYFVAAIYISLLYSESIQNSSLKEDSKPKISGIWLIKLLLHSIFLYLLIGLFLRTITLERVYYYILPGVCLSFLILYQELKADNKSASARIKCLTFRIASFSFAFLVPIFVYTIVVYESDQLGDFLNALFVSPQKRLNHAAAPLPSIKTSISTAILIALFWLDHRYHIFREKLHLYILTVVLLVLLYFGRNTFIFENVFLSMRNLSPILSVLFTAKLLQGTGEISNENKIQFFTVFAFTCFSAFIMFPYSTLVYFMYHAAFVIIAGYILLLKLFKADMRLLACISAFYIIFAALWGHTSDVKANGRLYYPKGPYQTLAPNRLNLEVADFEAQIYSQVAELIKTHSRSDYILAGPDCPEIYYLSGRRSPTNFFYDFFRQTPWTADEFDKVLEKYSINLIVVNTLPEFSDHYSDSVAKYMYQNFKYNSKIDRFIVAWR